LAILTAYPGDGLVFFLMAEGCFQNENLACRSTLRFDEAEANGPPPTLSVSPNNDELRFPTGFPGLKVLNRLRAETLKVKL